MIPPKAKRKRHDGTAAVEDADVIGNTVGIQGQTSTYMEGKDPGNEARTVQKTEPQQAMSKARLCCYHRTYEREWRCLRTGLPEKGSIYIVKPVDSYRCDMS